MLGDAAREISCGTAAGIASKFVDFPFDTIKVRIQMKKCKEGAVECATNIAARRGFWGFYSGILSPCVGAGFETAAAFLMFGRASDFLMNHCAASFLVPEAQRGSGSRPDDKPLWVVTAAGAFSGIGTATVLTPVELLKSRCQTHPRKYPSVPQCLARTLREEGPLALTQGYSATLAREIPGLASWFFAYELALRRLFLKPGQTRQEAAWYVCPAAGACGGILYWSVLYPADVLKTRMQTHKSYANKTLAQGMKLLYRDGGVRAMYSGFAITLFRAIPANATIFGVYEAADRQWQRSVRPSHAVSSKKTLACDEVKVEVDSASTSAVTADSH